MGWAPVKLALSGELGLGELGDAVFDDELGA
jgi:ribonuclease HII